jgi:acetyl esterase/lipase
MIRQTPEELLAIIRSFVPDPETPITRARKDFSSFFGEFQEDAARTARWERAYIRPDLQGYWITVPELRDDRVVLFFHSGGFTMGSTGDHLGLCARIAQAAHAPVFSVDYRLAPEEVFPAPVEDAVEAYEYLRSGNAGSHRIIPVGISAGGTLVISLLLSLRENGIPLPAAAVCMSPMVDILFSGESFTRNRGADWITPASVSSVRERYLGGRDPMDPIASPLHAPLKGMPRLYLQAGTHEVLVDSITSFVQKARWAGVPVQFDLWEGMFHCWQVFAGQLAEGQEALDRLGEFVRNS